MARPRPQQTRPLLQFAYREDGRLRRVHQRSYRSPVDLTFATNFRKSYQPQSEDFTDHR